MSDRNISILLVEDNDDDVLMLRECLKDTGLVQIEYVAPDGAVAIDQLRRRLRDGTLPDLVLMDINMPGTNGFQVLKALKGDPWLSHLPVVVFTTSQREEDVLRAYRHGACSYVTKPQGLAQFRQMLLRFAEYWAYVARVPSRCKGDD